MREFWKCFWYLIVSGIFSFFLGRVVPKKWFFPEKFPYRPLAFEKGGSVYEVFQIRKWKNKVPDMSRILPQLIPAKNLSGNYKERLPRMLQETCVAEWIHILLCFSGLFCLNLYPGIGGVLIFIIYVFVFNLPFIVIQRYNRPRLMRVKRKIDQMAEKERSVDTACEHSY